MERQKSLIIERPLWPLPFMISTAQKLLSTVQKLFLKNPKILTKAATLYVNIEDQGWEKRRKARFPQAH